MGSGEHNSRIGWELDKSKRRARVAADLLLNEAEFRDTYKRMNDREQRRWRYEVARKLRESVLSVSDLLDGVPETREDLNDLYAVGPVEDWLRKRWKLPAPMLKKDQTLRDILEED